MELEPTGDGSISVDLTPEEVEGLKTNTSDVIEQLQNENQTATEEVVSDEQTTEPSTEASKDKNPTFAESYNEQSGDFDVSNPVKALENAPNYPAAMGHGFVNAGLLDSKVYERSKLVPGNYFLGPGLVVQMDCTVLVPPDWKAKVDGWHNLILEQS